MKLISKQSIIDRVAESNDLKTKAAARRTVNLFLDIITEELMAGNKVAISQFGRFSTRAVPAKTHPVPNTNRTVNKPAHTVAKFRASNALRLKLA